MLLKQFKKEKKPSINQKSINELEKIEKKNILGY